MPPPRPCQGDDARALPDYIGAIEYLCARIWSIGLRAAHNQLPLFPMTSESPPITRRTALQTLGVGLAILALPKSVFGQTSAPAAATPELFARPPFELPPLPYAYDALEPHFDARTMEIHHTKHHQAYITGADRALATRPDLLELDAGAIIAKLPTLDEPLQSALRNNVGGHLNHALFWTLLAPTADYAKGPLRLAIERRFGSLESFQQSFNQAAASRFGSGWAWLVWQNGRLEVLSTPNQDSPLMFGAKPILGLDVWEHAYYLAYQNRRTDYINAFWNVVNWDAAEAIYAEVAA